jgi:hypothetical protein
MPRSSVLFAALGSLLLTFVLAGATAWFGPARPALSPPVGVPDPSALNASPRPAADTAWTVLADGLDLGRFALSRPAPVGDALLTVLRVDPAHWRLRLLSVSGGDLPASASARDWLEAHDLRAVTNAGMFATDARTHVGYMRAGDHVNSHGVNRYQSVAAFDPVRPGLPPFRLFDLDVTPLDTVRARYASLVQNLRLIKRPGENRWGPQAKRWSEAALAEDDEGRALLIHTRTPYSMHDLNAMLLDLPLCVVAAQHLEGGPEAQLVFRGAARDTTALVGSYETGFFPPTTTIGGGRSPMSSALRRARGRAHLLWTGSAWPWRALRFRIRDAVSAGAGWCG